MRPNRPRAGLVIKGIILLVIGVIILSGVSMPAIKSATIPALICLILGALGTFAGGVFLGGEFVKDFDFSRIKWQRDVLFELSTHMFSKIKVMAETAAEERGEVLEKALPIESLFSNIRNDKFPPQSLKGKYEIDQSKKVGK